MSLSDLATFSTALSGLAVTASLIYLALQTHQNSKHTRALIHQGRIAGIRDLAVAATNTDLAAAIVSASGVEPTQELVRRAQFRFYCAASFYGWQDSFSQHEGGLLDEDIFRQMRTAVVTALGHPAMRAEWNDVIRVPGTKFAAFVDGIIATLPPS